MDQNFATVEEWRAAGSPVGDENNSVTIGGSTATVPPPEPPKQEPQTSEQMRASQEAAIREQLAPTAQPTPEMRQATAPQSTQAIEAEVQARTAPDVGSFGSKDNAYEYATRYASAENREIILQQLKEQGYQPPAEGFELVSGAYVPPTITAPVVTPKPETSLQQTLIDKITTQGGLFQADKETVKQAIELGLYRDASGVPITYSDYTKLQSQNEKSQLASTLLPEIEALGGVDAAIRSGQIDKVRQAIDAGLYTVNGRPMTAIDLLDRQLAVADENMREFALSTIRAKAPTALTPGNEVYIERALSSGVDPSILRMLNLPNDKIEAAQQTVLAPKIEQGLSSGRISDSRTASSLLGVVTMGPAPEQPGGLVGLLSFGNRKALFGQEGPLKGLISPQKIGDGKYGYLGTTGVIPIVRENLGAPIIGNLVSAEAAREAGFNVSPLQWTGAAIATALQILPFAVKLPSGAVVTKFAPGTAIEDIALGRATGVPVRGLGEISTLEGKLVNIPADISGGEQFAAGLARSNIQDLPVIWENGSPSYLVRGEAGQPFKLPVASLESFGRNLGKVQYEESGGVYRPSYYIGKERIPIGGSETGGTSEVIPPMAPREPAGPTTGGVAAKIARGESLTLEEEQYRVNNAQQVEDTLQRFRSGSSAIVALPTVTPPQVVPYVAPAPISIPSPETKETPVALPIPPAAPVIISPIAPIAPSITTQPIPGLIGITEPSKSPEGISIPEPVTPTAPQPVPPAIPAVEPVPTPTGEEPTPTPYEPIPPQPSIGEPGTPQKPVPPPTPVLTGSGSIYRGGDVTGDTIITNLSGQVRDSLTNIPIVKALVRVINSAGAKSQRLTDQKGRYQFTDINPDYYTVLTTKEGYDAIQVKKLVNQGENRLDFKPRQTGVTTIQAGPATGQTILVPPPSAPASRPLLRVATSQPGVIALKQGDSGFYTVIYPPYQPNNIVHMKVPPPDALILPNIGQAYKTIVSMGGNGNVLLNEYRMDSQYRRPKPVTKKRKAKRKSTRRAIMLRGTFKIERLR